MLIIFFVNVNYGIQDWQVTITKRKEEGDIRELKRVYYYYRDYFMRHEKAFDLEQR